MSHGDATKIFLECFKNVEQGEAIRSNDYTEDEIADAIYEVAYLTTHNGITKDSIINALRWLSAPGRKTRRKPAEEEKA